jgi:glycyl-tRNA synthetase (class II)
MDINSIEAYESFKDDLRQCDKCKSMFHIDDVFLDISEICDATNTEIEIYEKNNQVNLSNFWCVDCSSKTLKEIER